MATPSWFLYAFIPLLLWRIYARVRRNIGRQRSRPWRHWFGVTLFPALVLLFALAAMTQPLAEAALWGGFAGGVVLAFVGLRLTRFERTPEGFFYTPNAYIGVGLSLLLVGRILYRMTQLSGAGGAGSGAYAHPDFARSPLTLLIFGLVAGYYATYAAGLLRQRRKARSAPPL
ncbi:MAG TPA: hypothetical protein VFE23_09995 [Usitatibacter sp.]|jgi:hypothetical protein|nr:hypothetical protein [Usitatibacter sp.]